MAFDSTGNLFVVDNSAGNIYQGSIYEYKSDGSRVTLAALAPTDRPAGLACDSMGNLYMADLGGNIYKYNVTGILRRQGRMIFGSVPNSAQSLAFDNAGNLLVVNVVNAVNTDPNGNAIFKFTPQGGRSMFVSGPAFNETFSHLAFQPIPVTNEW